jgi:hypothetical protein
MMTAVGPWIVAGAIVGGGAGVLVPLLVETAYWFGLLDPVVPHYLNQNVLLVWPTAAWLLSAGAGSAARAFLILALSILANAALYAAFGAGAGAVARAITRAG